MTRFNRIAICRAVLALLAALAVCAVKVTPAAALPAGASIVAGAPIPIENVPWQIYLQIGDAEACGGSVLDATHVLSAAHCVVAPGQTTPRPASSFKVLAGFTDLSTWDGGAPPAGSQISDVASVRVHPLYEHSSKTDDVAVLTLSTALNLSGPRTRAVALAPVLGGPAAGVALSFSGYGAQTEGQPPNGRLYGIGLSAISDVQCRPHIASNASASVLCVSSASGQGPCFGDSAGRCCSAACRSALPATRAQQAARIRRWASRTSPRRRSARSSTAPPPSRSPPGSAQGWS